MIITFCGHNDVSEVNKVKEWLFNVLDQFIYEENVICYLGGYGEFDRLAASVVRQKQKVNPAIQSVLIIPYLNRKYDESNMTTLCFRLWNPFHLGLLSQNETSGWLHKQILSLRM